MNSTRLPHGPQSSEHYKTKASTGARFAFGRNWRGFLSVVNKRRIAEAKESLRNMFDAEQMEGKTFLDVGSGSGLFSLAACRLGATVHSFDTIPIQLDARKSLDATTA